MKKVELKIKLTFKAPVLTRAAAIGAYGVDSPMARNANGDYCLPRTLVKDCLRDALCELRDADTAFAAKIDEWFGDKSEQAPRPASGINAGGTVEPFRALWQWSDFIHPQRKEADGKTFRICIDRDRGAVDEGAYQVIETPFAAGERVTFEGVIDFYAEQTEAEKICRVVRFGFNWLMSAGALKNIGFGELLEANVEMLSDEISDVVTSLTPFVGESFDLIVKPEAPFCLARRRTNPNLFESSSVIPGGALKGSLATTWLKLITERNANYITEDITKDSTRRNLAKNFHLVRFTHAFPSQVGTRKRTVVAPYSLVKSGGTLYDVALCERPGLVGQKPAAPSFQIDWKPHEHDDVNKLFGRVEPPGELQVRTSIERKRAKEAELFAYEKIVPDGFEWYARVDLSRITNDAERAAVEIELRDLLVRELRDLGKTKANAAIEAQPPLTIPSVKKSKPKARGGIWALTLQTPAVLCDPRELNEASGEPELRAAYQQTWSDISNGALELVRYFAAQSLAGGKYLHDRFQASKPYNPFLLTDAGSVFVLKPTRGEDVAAPLVADWLLQGLPLPRWAIELYTRGDHDGAHWSNNPFIPENGYGEIAVNLEVHWNKKPGKGEWHEFPEAMVD